MLDPHRFDAAAEAAIARAKNFPRKGGRPSKDFGPVIQAAVLVLRDAGLSQNAIAQELKVNPATVRRMCHARAKPIDTKNLAKIKDVFSENIADIINKMLTTANTHEYVQQLASSRNPGLIQAISMLIEKLQLLHGKPSNITEVRDTAKLVEDKMKELEDLEKSLQQSLTLPENPKDN